MCVCVRLSEPGSKACDISEPLELNRLQLARLTASSVTGEKQVIRCPLVLYSVPCVLVPRRLRVSSQDMVHTSGFSMTCVVWGSLLPTPQLPEYEGSLWFWWRERWWSVSCAPAASYCFLHKPCVRARQVRGVFSVPWQAESQPYPLWLLTLLLSVVDSAVQPMPWPPRRLLPAVSQVVAWGYPWCTRLRFDALPLVRSH